MPLSDRACKEEMLRGAEWFEAQSYHGHVAVFRDKHQSIFPRLFLHLIATDFLHARRSSMAGKRVDCVGCEQYWNFGSSSKGNVVRDS